MSPTTAAREDVPRRARRSHRRALRRARRADVPGRVRRRLRGRRRTTPYRISGNVVNSTASPSRASAIDDRRPRRSRQDGRDGCRGPVAVCTSPRRRRTPSPLDGTTLPEGIAVVDRRGRHPATSRRSRSALGGRVKTVNFFLGEGERSVTELLRPARAAHRQRPELRPDARARRGRALARSSARRALELRARRDGDLRRRRRPALVGPSSSRLPVVARHPAGGDPERRASGWCSTSVLWRPLRRRGLGRRPAHDRQHRPLAGAALHLPVLHRRRHDQLPGARARRSSYSVSVPMSADRTSASIAMAQHRRHRRVRVLAARAPASARRPARSPTTRQLAAASGIDVDRVVRIVWIIAGALAGLAGILYAYFRPGIKWDMGAQVLLLMFAAVTLGGLGTAFGALVGSLIVGLLVEVSTPLDPVRPQVRGRARRAHRDPARSDHRASSAAARE